MKVTRQPNTAFLIQCDAGLNFCCKVVENHLNKRVTVISMGHKQACSRVPPPAGLVLIEQWFLKMDENHAPPQGTTSSWGKTTTTLLPLCQKYIFFDSRMNTWWKWKWRSSQPWIIISCRLIGACSTSAGQRTESRATKLSRCEQATCYSLDVKDCFVFFFCHFFPTWLISCTSYCLDHLRLLWLKRFAGEIKVEQPSQWAF